MLWKSAIQLCVIVALAGCATSSKSSYPNTISLKVDGMACPNCAKHIEQELKQVPGVETASVDFDTKTAMVTVNPQNPATESQLNAAVAQWKKEHFAVKEDPECLDPKKREEMQKGK
ncbi:MAG: cation transporter [Planctomycetes bacterium]|nr:cation transporter [Planctomycetota bacterium]